MSWKRIIAAFDSEGSCSTCNSTDRIVCHLCRGAGCPACEGEGYLCSNCLEGDREAEIENRRDDLSVEQALQQEKNNNLNPSQEMLYQELLWSDPRGR